MRTRQSGSLCGSGSRFRSPMADEAVVTVRLVRSFEHRNFKPVVFRGVCLDQTVRDFMDHVLNEITSRPGLPPPFRKYPYGEYQNQNHLDHGTGPSESSSLEDDDKLILQIDQSLKASGVGKNLKMFFIQFVFHQLEP
uniref:Uncharacterized protein n=1 Tax=Sphaeramia orbicularis TaxID=375764 RepID=A0A672ZVV5_9TELE